MLTSKGKVILNVGGTRFETYHSTLKKIPATRLSRLTEALANYDPLLNEYFFDRHPGVFSQILNYYRTGKLHYPNNVCGQLFEEELNFWGLDSNQVEPCCWMTYTRHRTNEENLATLDDIEQSKVTPLNSLLMKFGWDDNETLFNNLPWYKKLRLITWQLLEEPDSSMAAKVTSNVSLFFVLLSVFAFVIETLPSLSPYSSVVTTECKKNSSNIFQIVHWICDFYLTTELLIRFIVCPRRKQFFKSIVNIIDLLAPIWLLITTILRRRLNIDNYVLNIISNVRVLRLFKVFNHYSGLRVIVASLRYNAQALWLFVFVILLAMMINATFICYAERLMGNKHEAIASKSIFDWWWFSVVTASTVGYGDLYPGTFVGKLFGFVCALSGVLVTDLPMAIIVQTFTDFYRYQKARSKLPKKRRRIVPVEAPRDHKKLSAMS